MTLVKVLWVGWPFLASLGFSRSRLPGKTLATVLFLILLVAVVAIGGFFVDAPLVRNDWGRDVFEIAIIEATVLMVAAELLADAKWSSRQAT